MDTLTELAFCADIVFVNRIAWWYSETLVDIKGTAQY